MNIDKETRNQVEETRKKDEEIYLTIETTDGKYADENGENSNPWR